MSDGKQVFGLAAVEIWPSTGAADSVAANDLASQRVVRLTAVANFTTSIEQAIEKNMDGTGFVHASREGVPALRFTMEVSEVDRLLFEYAGARVNDWASTADAVQAATANDAGHVRRRVLHVSGPQYTAGIDPHVRWYTGLTTQQMAALASSGGGRHLSWYAPTNPAGNLLLLRLVRRRQGLHDVELYSVSGNSSDIPRRFNAGSAASGETVLPATITNKHLLYRYSAWSSGSGNPVLVVPVGSSALVIRSLSHFDQIYNNNSWVYSLANSASFGAELGDGQQGLYLIDATPPTPSRVSWHAGFGHMTQSSPEVHVAAVCVPSFSRGVAQLVMPRCRLQIEGGFGFTQAEFQRYTVIGEVLHDPTSDYAVRYQGVASA